ncbi:hypothetical protein E3P99_03876 [Wallemia hederae]|uniref:Uncharacterized protein n=1 Tax=Wallemia hederae TaxID=1540922 RepID=A0A4T0FCJ2_9BASI|nr:hypothetical protein E3P99_03876 [Wallemia hederae]
MTNELSEIITPNAVFASARRRWGYDHDLYAGSSISSALKQKQPKIFSVEMGVYSTRVTLYQNTLASTQSARVGDYVDDDDNRTLVGEESGEGKEGLEKSDDTKQAYADSVLAGDNDNDEAVPPILERSGKKALSTAYRAKYMRSAYTVEIFGFPGQEITLERGSHYLSIKKRFTLAGQQYVVEGKRYDLVIRNLATNDIVCTYSIKTFAMHKSGVLRFSMPANSSLYERLAMFTIILVEWKFINECCHGSLEGVVYAGVLSGMAKATSSRIKDE